MNEESESRDVESLPMAKVRPTSHRLERIVLVTIIAALLGLAGYLTYASSRRAMAITIHFADGFGLKFGDTIRHRGIDVGRVTSIGLNADLSGVDVVCELFAGAEQLARAGSQFWIVRPSVSLSGVKGLETIVGGRYLAVLPGPPSAEAMTEFEGRTEAPGNATVLNGGLEIVLETLQRQGLDRGIPVLYRGMHVGEVLSVALASDSLTVEARAVIAADYRDLVRENSVFWNDSGVNVHVGLGGLDLDVGTLETLAAGGISFATPDPPGDQIHTGHRFLIEPEEVEDWREWQSNLVVGSSSLPEGCRPPTLLRAELITSKRSFGIRRESRRGGWLLPLQDGRILGSALMLVADGDQNGPTSRLAFAGQELILNDQQLKHVGEFAVMQPSEPINVDVPTWPAARLRRPTELEDCLLFSDRGKHPFSLSRRRLTAMDRNWHVDPAVGIHQDLLGSAVVSRRDGAIVGLISFHNDQPLVALVPREISADSSPATD